MNKVGDKIDNSIRQSTVGERIKDWAADNVNSPAVKFVKGIGTFIKLYFEALLIGIIALPVAIWKIITNVHTKTIILGALMGMVLIIATVVKFFSTSGSYPLRAVFFINFGFVLFIGSFALIILHLIYEIAYK